MVSGIALEPFVFLSKPYLLTFINQFFFINLALVKGWTFMLRFSPQRKVTNLWQQL